MALPVSITRLFGYWQRVRGSYWFVPLLMTLGAIALAFATTALDRSLAPFGPDTTAWLFMNGPEAARILLSTVAGSLITVAGVTFSVTIVAIANASSKFGPRLLTNFMFDLGNQITLGTFVATFVFCILVLRTVQGTEDSETQFVPHLAVMVGMLLTLASLGVLIFFIHHVPDSINVSHMVARIGEDLESHIRALYPSDIGGPARATREPRPPPEDADFYRHAGAAIAAHARGYLQHIDADGLMKIARENDLVITVMHQPGDFAVKGKPLATVWPRERAGAEVAEALRSVFIWGRQRTMEQDAMFLFNELVEIAVRALSPGVNDPFTAKTCIHWLGHALQITVERRTPDPFRYDADGRLRVIAPPLSVGEMTDGIFEVLRGSVERDRLASLALMEMIGNVMAVAQESGVRENLHGHADALVEGCRRAMSHPRDIAAVEAAHAALPPPERTRTGSGEPAAADAAGAQAHPRPERSLA